VERIKTNHGDFTFRLESSSNSRVPMDEGSKPDPVVSSHKNDPGPYSRLKGQARP
jgi:hypothetical protein